MKLLIRYFLATLFAGMATVVLAMADYAASTVPQPYPKCKNHSPFVHDAPNPDTENESLPNHLHPHNEGGYSHDTNNSSNGSSHHNADGSYRNGDGSRRDASGWHHNWSGWNSNWDRLWLNGQENVWADSDTKTQIINGTSGSSGGSTSATKDGSSGQTKASAINLPNFGAVYRWLYRGGQPTEDGLEELYQNGVRTVVDLRCDKEQAESERQLCQHHDLRFVNISIDKNLGPSNQDISRFLDIVESARTIPADGSVYVHCHLGSDRTGCMVALYQILCAKYSFDKAYQEMLRYGFNDSYAKLKQVVLAMAQGGRPQINPPIAQNHPALSKTLKNLAPSNLNQAVVPTTRSPEIVEWDVASDPLFAKMRSSVKVNSNQPDKQALIPNKTWLFFVGILTFSDGRADPSFGTGNRRDVQLVSLLKDRGVPNDHICFLKDWDGTVPNIKRQFVPFLQGTQPGDLLIDYYTGHGGDGSFETCDGGSYNHSWIGNAIARGFKGSQVLLLGDCCESGSLEDVVEDRADEPIGYACISSSSRKECGHGRWTFSQAVLDALNGEPYVDLDKDGYITVDELARHVRQDILAYENNHSVYKKTANFNGGMIIAKTKSGNSFTPIPVKVWYDGSWWKAKEVDSNGTQARIRWIQLGYDSPDQDVWIDLDDVKPIQVDED